MVWKFIYHRNEISVQVPKLAYYIIITFIMSSCSFYERTDDILIARLGDSYLYQSDIKYLQNQNISTADSLAFVQQYAHNWAREELLLAKAELNINQEELEIDKRLEDYRRSLLIHAYEQKLINQSIDTIVDTSELELYYQEHADDYILADKIAQLMYVKVSVMAPDLDSLTYWLFDDDTLKVEEIEAYSHQYAKRFYNNPTEWLPWSDFLEVFPSEFDFSTLSMEKNTISLEDSLHVYLVRLMNVKKQGEIAPIEYVQEEIKSILLNQKKLRTVDLIQSKLLEDAKKSKQFQIY